MPWDDLTEIQQTFLRTYLQSSTWDFMFGAENSSANKPVIAGFEEFEGLARQYQDLIGSIPDDYPERLAIEQAATEAMGLRDEGKFADANRIMSRAVADIGTTVTILMRVAEELRTKAKPVIAGATVDETNDVDRLHGEIMDALSDDLPSRADVRLARELADDLDELAQLIQSTVERRREVREKFDEAVKLVRPALEGVASATPEAWLRRMTGFGEIEAAINEAGNLLQEVEDAESSVDEAEHVSVTQKLMEWNKTASAYDDLVEDSRLGMEQALREAYAKFETELDNNCDLNLSSYPDADEMILAPLMQELEDDRKGIREALVGGDPAEQMRQFDGIGDVERRLAEFQRLREIARDNRQKEYLLAGGVSGEQAQRIAKMRQASPELVDTINAVVENANKVLGDIEVTTEIIEDRKKEEDKHWKEYEAAGSTLKSIKSKQQKLELAQKALSKKMEMKSPGLLQEMQDITERLSELEDDTSTDAEKERKRLEKRIEEVRKEIDPADFDEMMRLGEEMSDLEDEEDEAKTKKSDAYAVWQLDTEFIKAAESKKRMLDAVTFGPLSQDRNNPLDPDDVKTLIELYEKDWKVADHAVETVGAARNPESVMSAVNTLSGRLDNNFGAKKWTKTKAQNYANHVITMAGSLPTELVDLLGDYLDNDYHLESVPEMDEGKTFDQLAKSRTSYVTDLLVNDDGTLDLEGGIDGLCDVVFHPDSVRNGTPVFASHMFETIKFLEGSPTAGDKIKAITLPTDPGALSLLSKGSGTPVESITEEIARKEVVNAMLTPVYQGNIGSCFATAGVLRLRQSDPDRALDLFTELATKGTFTPKNPDPTVVSVPIPAVLNVPKGDNPLIRSLEFTVGTAAAIDQDSTQNKRSVRRTAKAVEKVKDKIKPTSWNTVKAKLKRAIPAAFTFSYNSDVESKDSRDGSSTKGGYELISKADGKGVSSEEDYVKVVTPIVIAQIDASDLEDGVTEETIRDLVKSRDFLDAMKVNGKMPWELSSGGYSTEATKVLEGTSVTGVDFLPEFDPTGDLDQRTQAIVESLLTSLDGVTDDLSPLVTGGIHAFNALPQHPSLAKLTNGGPGSIATNFRTEVLDKGTAIKNTDIPVAQAALMVEKQLRRLGKKAKGPVLKALEDAILVHRPTAPMKPAALKALMKTACSDYVDAVAKVEADEWKQKETEKNSVEPSIDDYNKKLDEKKKAAEKWVESTSSNILIADLDAPQFVIADSNWGDSQSRTLFVLCPDPETGKPRLYKKDDPGGDMRPMDDNWLKTNWQRVQ